MARVRPEGSEPVHLAPPNPGVAVTGKTRGATAPRPRSGYVNEDERHTVRVRVPKARWGLSTADAVIRAVKEAVG